MAAILLAVPIFVYIFRHLKLTHAWKEEVLLMALCLFLSVLGTLTAWLVVRYDIGYKS